MNRPRVVAVAVPAELVRTLPRGTLYRVPGVVPTGALLFGRVVRP